MMQTADLESKSFARQIDLSLNSEAKSRHKGFTLIFLIHFGVAFAFVQAVLASPLI